MYKKTLAIASLVLTGLGSSAFAGQLTVSPSGFQMQTPRYCAMDINWGRVSSTGNNSTPCVLFYNISLPVGTTITSIDMFYFSDAAGLGTFGGGLVAKPFTSIAVNGQNAGSVAQIMPTTVATLTYTPAINASTSYIRQITTDAGVDVRLQMGQGVTVTGVRINYQ